MVFRGWQVNPNSIFGDGIPSALKKHSEYLRPQMDVWFRSALQSGNLAERRKRMAAGRKTLH
jgi:hypothetical protein